VVLRVVSMNELKLEVLLEPERTGSGAGLGEGPPSAVPVPWGRCE
jgi:hypothetical protein